MKQSSDFSYDTGHLEAPEGEQRGRWSEAIAVIGMAGFFPGSSSLEEFCSRLDQQESLFIKPPANHFIESAVSDRYGAFLDDISQFDPDVFKITPLEAEYLDPRQRLLLMSVWHALEDACYVPDALAKSRTDVYAASEGCPYTQFVRAAEITPYSPTGPSTWSIANRISHAFRFRGKSICIDTACSGGLVAIHQAMQALRRNEADYAIVGAANLLFGEQASLAYLGQESLGILGDSQSCYPFQNEAKGFLPAEGVVTVVLKRLSEAIHDNDNIHVVLLGSHMNHNGGSGTLTMPSAAAQAEAIVGAYIDAQIAPWTVTYIEAHGASSVLADAEEIQAFKAGDRKLRDLFKAETCSPCKISTIKPNIGHANCVSGLMSLVRVVHSLKHAKKLGIKNFSACSNQISLDGTRFYINDKTESWEQLTDESGAPIPRRAAINNFGAGGVNVHLLVEEYVRTPVESVKPPDTACFLAFSALHAEQLQKQVFSLSTHIKQTATSIPPEDLETLFIASRTAFPRRLVFRYKNVGELLEKLERYHESNGMKGYHLKSDTRDQSVSVELFHKHQQLSEFLSTLGGNTDKAILFELWSLGIEEPIRNYYRGSRCLKRSLPRYPFATKAFWAKPLERNPAGPLEHRSFQINPLLHHNTSDLSEQRYTSVFTGDEFFLAQHVVKGRRVLPGVAYLEMVRAAVADATRSTGGPQGIQLKNVVWARPIIVDDEPKTIHTRLKPRNDGRIDFEIYSALTAKTSKPIVHCQGSAGLMFFETAPILDIEKHELERHEFTISADQCYGAFKALGIHHGAAFQGLDVIHGEIGQVTARIVLPASVRANASQFFLHPSILDSAFQATLGLVADPSEAMLPFALQELEVFSPCPTQTLAIVRNSTGQSSTAKVRKVDIDLCDGVGRICVRMSGLATRTVEGDLGQTISLDALSSQSTTLLSAPETVPEPVSSTRKTPGDRLSERIETMLAAAIAKFLRITGKALDHNAEFSVFGFDSVSLTALANELNRTHSLELDPTLFFEHTTIGQLAEYLAHAHGNYFAKAFAIAVEDPPRSSPQPPERLVEASAPTTRFSTALKPSGRRPDSSSAEPIAIVGMSGRFPMAEDVNEFWQNLVTGRDCITEVPVDRWDWKEIYGDPRTEENKTNIKWGGFISGVDQFDSLFFGISPKEAELMDPQQRLLMMFVWSALEDAGYSAQCLSGTNTAIFVATGASGYGSILTKANVPIEAYTSTGMVPSVGPNRMSYYLNFHGPSEPIETACSSSLVAIHRAVVAIRTGSCDMAVAGGVSTMLTPDLHISFSKAGMLCEDGKCKTFSDRANGYVRGEGVGMLFLKKLRDAEQARDHIYGVILGSAENHGGRTNSLTAPNPKAQADVVTAAHKNAGIDPRSITYIEAHGTGTGLGDPIEINGLKIAFREADNGDGNAPSAVAYCGVGSVKTNIGHLELAAGVAGVIKVLLQMKYKRLAKSLHCENVNPYIQIDKSPFYLVRETANWPALQDADGKDLPRRAGVSSFGFGGVNAHVVIEEYVSDHAQSTAVGEDCADGNPETAILLSARNADRLQDSARRLYDYLRYQRKEDDVLQLEDIAFTLQVGRDAMDERLALIVDSVADLEEKLARVLTGHEAAENVFRRKVDRHDGVLSMFKDDGELSEVVDRWLQRGKVRELSELWVKGLPLDWGKLYRVCQPHRIALPAYPFAKQRCWAANQKGFARPSVIAASGSLIHPLIHQNTSTLREQRYSSTFSGDEYFLADHVLRGVRILPGVVYLEMARAAIRHATRDSSDWEYVQLRNVAWTSPFTVDAGPRRIDVVLSPELDGAVSFKVFSDAVNSERTLHFQGAAVRRQTPESLHIDLNELRAQCGVESMTSREVYTLSERMGFKYGPSFMTLDSVYKGIDQVVGTIRLPPQTATSLNEYVLHPSVMDAALQASMALDLDLNHDASGPVASPGMPYFANEVEILRPCTESMWCVIRPGLIENSGRGNIRTCDVDLCDESGSICVRIKGLSFILLEDGTSFRTRTDRSEGENESHALINDNGVSVEVRDEIQNMLIGAVSAITKMDPHSLELDGELTQYGFDSISLIALSDSLNKAHNLELTPAVFFEYPSIRSLSTYLLERYRPIFEHRYSSAGKSTKLPGLEPPEPAPAQRRTHQRFLSDGNSVESAPSKTSNEPIAIVGMSGRFPMADDIQQFWENLANDKDCISEIPKDRWDWKEYFGDPRKDRNKTNVKWGGFISGVDEFDPLFFGISPKEAELMDPNQRLLMEFVWKAIEDAGYSAEGLSGSRTAIIVGMGVSGYHGLASSGDMAIESFTSTGMAPCLGPNRMSYFLNFRGPSEPVETACSSSLIALHRARILIQNDICDMAVVGGINTIVTPLLHISFSKAGMLSEDGRCKAFSDKANGYVRGEGVGMLFLKRLKDAERAGDHIYGVILGSAENHGGHATSLTAPNPHAQSEVIRDAYSAAGVDPRTITYIEAHGTGTGLGDPVEINALKSVFRECDQANDSSIVNGARCGIGAVKSNIGHLELAAGVAGVIKVLLQLQHQRLAKSLHCETINPYIELQDSPFYILQHSRYWQPIQDAAGHDIPRRAGISSFGFGGVNAHVVVEEYVRRDNRKDDHGESGGGESFAIVLSAKSPERLQVIVRNLRDYLERARKSRLALRIQDLAYTLQVGRDAMEERMALSVGSLDELRHKLEILTDVPIEVGAYRGTMRRRGNSRGVSATDGEMQKAVETWIEQGAYERILELWVQGHSVDWSQFYAGTTPKRLSLPAYPFAQEKYWIDTFGRTSSRSISTTGRIHPLVHENCSTLQEQKFQSVFSESEFFLEDHIVNGRRVLPAVAYLEMARAAAILASGDAKGDKFVRIRNVAWSRPLVVDREPAPVVIRIYSEQGGPELKFEISSPVKAPEAPLIHSQGRILISSASERPTVDLKTIRESCAESFSASECYDLFAAAGVDYGPAHRGIEKVYVGKRQVLARLALPTKLAESERDYVLHPSLMDSAIQCVAGLLLSSDEVNRELSITPGLPFAVDEVEIFGRCETQMWAILRPTTVGTTQRFDVEMVNDREQCCIRFRGLSSRRIEGQEGRRSAASRKETLFYLPQMVESNVAAAGAAKTGRRVVVLCGAELKPAGALLEVTDDFHFLQLESKQKDIGLQFEDYAIGLFAEVQRILGIRTEHETLVQVVVPVREDSIGDENCLLTGLKGMLAVAERENARCRGQLITMNPLDAAKVVVERIRNDSRHPQDTFVRYVDGRRLICRWEKVLLPESVQPPWKDHGVYLITGGAGGLGCLVAKEIAAAVEAPTLILTGRSALNDEIAAKVEQIESSGAHVCYWTLDVTNRSEVAGTIASIQREFGGINGVIHAAGIVRDKVVLRKGDDEFREVLAAKVKGLVNLDLETQSSRLDCFILFSSATAVLGNAGQSDYATANAFMDAYASYRNRQVAAKQRYGRTLSINWPLWKEGGMKAPAEIQKVMEQRFGIVPMPTESGIQALSRAFASGQDQVLVLHADPEIIDTRLLELSARPSVPSTHARTGSNGGRGVEGDQPLMVNQSLDYIKSVLSSVIKLPAQRIDVDAPLENYGIDSVMAMQLTDALENVFGSLSKTLFFEYQTIRELTGFFVENHRDKLLEVTGAPRAAKDDARKREIDPAPSSASLRPAFQKGEGDIAIIGLSGRYPGADNIAEFWRNLHEGRDSITEIPKDRWDHSLYFDEDKNKPGKTYGKWGGFLSGVDEFDPLFFNITPRDAEYIDPQERLFLQCVYETIEDAGYTRQSLAQYRDASGLPGNVGVYVGVMYEEYQLYGAQETIQGRPIALTGNPSSIANRVSYFFNFHGPSLALDTMCSSSLTALHLACESLCLGKCDVAIAGGVNVSVHPNKYLFLGQGRFISSKGRCESFGEGGDGYVPSEGVGAVLLKRLDQARVDGDRIYGVIKGTAINHGGKTNGYSVPNPNAQASVIERALQEAGVHPRTISYLEAHGTGTSLGDPIEIAGLNRVFQKYTQDRQFCAIGSVKSNIGHCESAAGIGGLTKVLLQMQHARLAPSLHSSTLNEAIDFEASPFVVQQQSSDWRRPVISLNGEKKEYPRIAGLSSFGAGGSNAHVIVEEYIPEDVHDRSSDREVPRENLIVLSAKNEDRLLTVAQNLHAFIRESVDRGRPVDLADLAYTLQVGRDAMEERVAIVANSIEETQDKLSRFTKRETAVNGVYRGNSRDKTDILSLLVSDGDLQGTIHRWMDEGKHDKLAALWVSGVSIDWRRMYQSVKPLRISLPTYPFEREKYWTPKTAGALPSLVPHARAAIHPLLHENTSTFSEQRFRTTFTGEERFLKDHRVKGKGVLPGVAYLEMACAGIGEASQIRADQADIVMRSVVWLRPLIVDGREEDVYLGLSADESGRIGYEVYGEDGTEGGERIVYSRGSVDLRSRTEAPRLNIAELESRCKNGSLAATECYTIYRNLGIEYGPAHQGIEKIYIGVGEVLAKLGLPTALRGIEEKYVLHPSMMDAALQATIGMFADEGVETKSASLKLALPFALEELEIYGRTTAEMWAYIKPSDGREAGEKAGKLDIDVCDEGGRVCARLKGLSTRELTGERTQGARSTAERDEEDADGKVGTFLLTPVWDRVAIEGEHRFPELSSVMVIAGGTSEIEEVIREEYGKTERLEIGADDTIEEIAERIRVLPAWDHLVWAPPPTRASRVTDEALIVAQRQGVLLGFRLIKALLREGFGSKSLGMTVITRNSQRITPNDEVDPAHATIHGFIGTLAKEYPAWRIRLLDLEADGEWPIPELFNVPADAQGNATVYRHGDWYKQQLIQFVSQKTGDIAVSD